MRTDRRLLAMLAFLPWLAAVGGAAPAGASLKLAHQLNQAFIGAARRTAPMVVVVNVVQQTPTLSDEADALFEPLPPGFDPQFHRPAPERTRSQGSGLIIRPDGYLLTNRHVVEDAESIEVRLQDGRAFPAVIHGSDAPSDLAVLKIDARGLPAATFADSSKANLGEFVIAVGAPFGLDFSMTFGHLSGKDRSNVLPNLDGSGLDQEFLQTDALISPGNSGGPLCNLDGEVIGINTLVHGIQAKVGFAIPGNLAKEIADQLIAHGKYTRCWLGIGIAALRDEPDFRALVPGVRDGVIVSSILSNSPAARSDLRPADVITAVDGHAVVTPLQLRREIRRKTAGRPIRLQVFRNGTTVAVQVLPEEWREPATPMPVRTTPDSQAPPPKLGLTVAPLTREPAARFGIESPAGVLVSTVEPGSLAARRNLRQGDVITSVNRQPVASPDQFQAAMQKADLKRGVLLILIRGDTTRFEILKP